MGKEGIKSPEKQTSLLGVSLGGGSSELLCDCQEPMWFSSCRCGKLTLAISLTPSGRTGSVPWALVRGIRGL